MKILLITVPIALLATVFSLSAAGQTPTPRGLPAIGFLSPQRLVAESAAGKANIARFQAAQAQKAGELRVKQQTLETTRQHLTQATDSSSRTQLQQQEQQERTELERATAQANTELQALQRQLQAGFQTKLGVVINDLAKGQNIQVILNSDTGVVWAAPGAGLDLTNAVVEQLNAATAAAPPAAAAPTKP